MDLNQTSDQMEMFGYTAEGVQQEVDKYIDKDAAPAKDITFKDAARFVAELTPVIGDAMAAKEVYDELQKEEPNYLLAGALGGATIIGLIPGIGDAAASAIKAGARKTLDVGKRIEVDPDAVGAMGANIRLNPKSNVKKTDDITKLNQDKIIDELSEIESASNPKTVKVSNKQKTIKSYKLFKTNKNGDLYPLFVKMEDNKPIPKGKWIKAEEGSLNFKTGKVKSSIGDLAYRPGFHAGDLPIATHIGGKIDLKTGERLKGSMPPNIREENQVWAEVEMLDEVDWQSIANKRARIKKDGTPDVKTAHITDQVPFGGFYRYKTNPNMTGNWLIGGELKVNKVLSSAEVKKINDKAGVSDLPKLSDLGLKFNEGGAVMDDQMKMAFMDEGGIADDGMDVDPVSGNEVPPGSLAEEVRDDIPAQLSEGEYVVPADVVRYYGVKFFEDLRDQAKMGLADMEANGRIGGEPVPAGGPINDSELSPQEMQAIQEMMGANMNEGGQVQNPYLQQQQLYSQPRPAPIDEKRNTTITGINPVENQMPMQSMASGGQVQGYQDSGDVMKDAPSFVQNQFDPAQYGLGYSFMGQPQQAGTTPSQAPQGQSFTVLYHPEYATNGKSKTFYLPRDSEIYQEYLGMGYTKQMPMTGPAGQGETPTSTDTPVTTDLTGSTVTTGSGPEGSNTGTSSINESIEDKDLDKTTKGLGLLADLSTALAGQLGVPIAALINTQAVAKYNDALKDQSKRKGSIFGGEGSLYEDLADTDGKKGKTFGDTWLGDLLGFDGAVGVPEDRPGLRESFMGARRGFDTAQLESTAPIGSTIKPKGRPETVYDPATGKTIVLKTSKPKTSKPKTQAQKDSAAKNSINDWVSATNATKGKKGIDRHKAIKAQSDASKKATKAIREASGYNKKNEGGLMNKKGKK